MERLFGQDLAKTRLQQVAAIDALALQHMQHSGARGEGWSLKD